MRSLLLQAALAVAPLTVSTFPRVIEGVVARLTFAIPKNTEKRVVTFDPIA
jgi:hypothetical protein